MVKKGLISIVLLIIILLFVFMVQKDSIENYTNNDLIVNTQSNLSTETLRIASFNIQVFGVTKASKIHVMDILVDILTQYDLIAIQEIRDISGTSVLQLMELLPNYNYIIGPREGRSSSKEQFLFVWDDRKFKMVEQYVFADVNDWFERNPMAVHFATYNDSLDFVIINNHVSPRDAEQEIPKLIDVVNSVEQFFDEPDIIILGDLNADGSYFDEELLINVFNEEDFLITTLNYADTTVASSDNTYDRIIITNDLISSYLNNWGVYYFDKNYNFIDIQPKEVSDHYPIWIEVLNGNDQD